MEKTPGMGWYIKKCLLGVLAALGTELGLLALAALLTRDGVIGEGETPALLASALGAFAGCLTAGRKTSRRVELTLFCAAAFWLLAQLLGAAFWGMLSPERALRLALAVLGGALGALAAGGGKRRRKRRAGKRRGRR